MSGSKISIFYFTLALFPIQHIFGIEQYCSLNTYVTNGTHMQFTKEPSVEEFAIVGKFKGLHCCAKGYRSIEWLKDGKQYPWPGTVSQLIIYPASENQTVYTQSVTPEDSGNYTCLLRNDSVIRAHNIRLRVYENIPDDPKITYISGNVDAVLGQSVRLFCEAFVGRVNLPDAYNEAIWRKAGQNSTTINEEPRIRQEKVSREDGQTFGTYLIIEKIFPEDYGEYVCKIIKPGKTIELSVYIREKLEVQYLDPNPIPWKKLLVWTSIIILIILTLLVIKIQYGLILRVQFKDSFGIIEENDGKTNDALILYSLKDSEFALGMLLTTLEKQCGYKCAAKEFPSNIATWCTDLTEFAVGSRRIIALLSPSCLNDKWDTTTVYEAIKQLSSVGPHLICVMLAKPPCSSTETKNSQGETLSSLIRNTCVITWERSQSQEFWLSLRLRLPPNRNYHQQINIENINLTQGENSSRLTRDSEESLDNLV